MNILSFLNQFIYDLIDILSRVHENIIIIGDPSETDIPYLRPICNPIGDRYNLSETNMPHRRPTCISKTHQRPICLIRDTLGIKMPY